MASEALVCSNCRCLWSPDPRVSKEFKTCTSCRESKKKSREKNRCPHDKRKERCKACKGSEICEHDKRKDTCHDCKGSQICEHDKIKNTCRDCKGSQICEHDKRKNTCHDCKGSQICEHDKIKNTCRDCKGSSFCEHDKIKYKCKVCDPLGNLQHRLRTRFIKVFWRIPYNPRLKWIDYLGCTISQIAERFEREVLPSQRDDYSVDHIKPVSKFDLTDEDEIKRCFHFTNIQFIPLTTNKQKGSNWTVEDEEYWTWNILAPHLRPRVEIVFCDECGDEIDDEE